MVMDVFNELGFPSVDALEPCYSCQQRCHRCARLFLEFEAAVSRGIEIITRDPELTLMDSQWLRDIIRDILEMTDWCEYGRQVH
jgi:hypothetical protein